MKKRARLTDNEKVDIVRAYEHLERVEDLAKKYGKTRQAIYKILWKAGVDTKKQRLPVSCTVCGTEVLRTKGRIRKQLHHFCSETCYYAWLKAGNGFPYIQSSHGQRIARLIVSKYFALAASHIVHHENRNSTDNRLENIRVFANQGDHVRYHRGFDVEPIWDGRNP